jgi:hypothetical protein
MRTLSSCLAGALASVLALGVTQVGVAHAQEAVEGRGVEVSPGTVLHPTVGADLGVINNVFYEDESPVTSGLLRLLVNFAVASDKAKPEEPIPGEEPGNEPAPPTFEFRASGGLRYEEYLYYDNFSTTEQRNLALDVQGHFQVYPQGNWTFVADDRLQRDTRPRNFEDPSSTNRIDNLLQLGMRWQPQGRSISAGARYENSTMILEGDSGVANRMNHTLALRSDWQWLPYTRFFGDVSLGFFGALGEAQVQSGSLTKNSSLPIRGLVGVATTLTEPLTLKLHLGWGYSSYSAGEGYNGPLLGAELGYAYGPTGRVVVEYNHDYEDSINANYYKDHKILAKLDQQVMEKLLLTGGLDLRLRSYRGIDGIGMPSRDDFLLGATARAQYVLSDRYYLSASYLGQIDATDYQSSFMGTDDPSYTRHELMLGGRAAF